MYRWYQIWLFDVSPTVAPFFPKKLSTLLLSLLIGGGVADGDGDEVPRPKPVNIDVVCE